jgi:hypothetical protein
VTQGPKFEHSQQIAFRVTVFLHWGEQLDGVKELLCLLLVEYLKQVLGLGDLVTSNDYGAALQGLVGHKEVEDTAELC